MHKTYLSAQLHKLWILHENADTIHQNFYGDNVWQPTSGTYQSYCNRQYLALSQLVKIKELIRNTQFAVEFKKYISRLSG